MSTFELIPYRLYLSQSSTWMHRMKAEIKIYILTILWISIFIFSYCKLCIVALSLIVLSLTVKNKQNIIQRHLLRTLVMTMVTTFLSFSIATNYKQYSQPKQSQDLSYYNTAKNSYIYQNILLPNSRKITTKQLRCTLKPALYFFITIYSIKLVMITTSPEILVITAYRSRIFNTILNRELLFTFLLSSHIVTNIISKLDKLVQVANLRGSLNLYKSSTRLFIFSFFDVSNLFFRDY